MVLFCWWACLVTSDFNLFLKKLSGNLIGMNWQTQILNSLHYMKNEPVTCQELLVLMIMKPKNTVRRTGHRFYFWDTAEIVYPTKKPNTKTQKQQQISVLQVFISFARAKFKSYFIWVINTTTHETLILIYHLCILTELWLKIIV